MRRLQARAAAVAFEAASGGRRTAGWRRSSTDANTAAASSLTILRELSRDLRRNNGWAWNGIDVIARNTVGWGITPRPKGVRGARAKAAIELWNAWAESTRCDHDGRLPFAGLQHLVMQTVAESGEALIIKQPATSADGLPIPLRIRVLEPDYLSPAKDGIFTDTGNVIIQGVEFDKRDQRVAYHIYTRHPGSGLAMPLKGGFQTLRVPAENVIHVYRVERPGQIRGVPWLARAIARLNDYDDFEDAELMLKKIAACFAAFITDIDGSATPIGDPNPIDRTIESFEPGQISYLTPGQDVKFSTPPSVTEMSFSVRNLRRIAVSIGVTYEDLTGDYSQVNYSSARMGRQGHYQGVNNWRWHMLIPQLCDGVWRWAMQDAAVLENWQQIPTAEWAPPPTPMLEPDKEALAYSRALRNGQMSWKQMAREQGNDPTQLLEEIAETNKELDDKGIILDSDARHTTATGQIQGAASPAKPEAAPPKPNGANGKAATAEA
jgi:lambda family phage portal protein